MMVPFTNFLAILFREQVKSNRDEILPVGLSSSPGIPSSKGRSSLKKTK